MSSLQSFCLSLAAGFHAFYTFTLSSLFVSLFRSIIVVRIMFLLRRCRGILYNIRFMHLCLRVSLCRCVLLTSPDDRTLFMYSRKDSSLISLSVNMKLMPFPCWPAVLYSPFRSSIRLAVLYELAQSRTHK